jgi:16S rRNA (guanine(966)-N(2))-methyltransferase RsmD
MVSIELPGSRFLDFFAGSGAVGLEALSRGAESAVFVEKRRQSADVIKANIIKTGFSERARILCMDAEKAAKLLGGEGCAFDVIYFDPPYGEGLIGKSLGWTAEHNLLAADGLIIAERRVSDVEFVPFPFKTIRTKKYGDTALDFIGVNI